MDASILTMFFCLILLVLAVLALNELMILKRKVNAHLDRTDLHTDKLHTILSILQQIEAKQDLLFNNAPPAPGQRDFSVERWINSPEVEQPDMDNADMQPPIIISSDKWKKLAQKALQEVKAKVSINVPPKKRGRPKKASKD